MSISLQAEIATPTRKDVVAILDKSKEGSQVEVGEAKLSLQDIELVLEAIPDSELREWARYESFVYDLELRRIVDAGNDIFELRVRARQRGIRYLIARNRIFEAELLVTP